jgi:hypothetical protein
LANPRYVLFKDPVSKKDAPNYNEFVDNGEMMDLGTIHKNCNMSKAAGGYAAGGDVAWMCDVRQIANNARQYKRVRFVPECVPSWNRIPYSDRTPSVYCDYLVTSLCFQASSTCCARHYNEGIKAKLAVQPESLALASELVELATELVDEVRKAVERRAGDLRRADPHLNLKRMLAPHEPSAAAAAAVAAAAAAMNEGGN